MSAFTSAMLIIASANPGVITFTPTRSIVLREDVLRLGDIADVSALPIQWRDAAAKLKLLRLPNNSAPVTLLKKDIASRARSLMPRLMPWFGPVQGSVSILRRKDDPMRLVASATKADGIAKDDSVRVSIVAGIYTIEREGIAMSDAKIGERLFIKTANRKALSVMCCGE